MVPDLLLLLAMIGAAVIPPLCELVPGVLATRSAPVPVNGSATCEDFTVLVPIYGSLRYLENVGYLAAYGTRVRLCTTSGETAEFYDGLELLRRAHGFSVFVADYHPGVAAGQRQVAGTTRDRVVREALGTVSTEYVVCIDADTTTDRPLGEAVGAAQRAGLDVASVPLRVANTGSLLTRLQAHEYRMSMRLRRLMPWLCSGACHLGRTAALREVMLRHSLFFQGNDAELGLIASQLGLRVGHLDFPVPTSVPSAPYAWWRQRFAWAGGEFRLWVVNARLARRHPWFVLYGAGLVHLCWPLRVMSLASPGWLLLGVAIVYIGVVLALNWRGRDYALLVYPLYGLLSSVVLVPLGVLSYVRMALASRNAGVIRAARRTDEQAHSFVEPLAS